MDSFTHILTVIVSPQSAKAKSPSPANKAPGFATCAAPPVNFAGDAVPVAVAVAVAKTTVEFEAPSAAQVVKFFPPKKVPTVIASAECNMCRIGPASVALDDPQ